MSEVLFQSKNLHKSFTNTKNGFSLKDISIQLRAGEITGVVGENGNGKTTLLRIIAGELSHTQGELSFSASTNPNTGWRNTKETIAYIPQRIPQWYGLLKENLQLKAAIHGIKGNENEQLIDYLIDRLGLSEFINHKWSEISTGYRLRFQLAKMLIGSPKLLVLDEPLANLDVNAEQKFMNDLSEIVAENKDSLSVILSSQQLHEIESISDQIIFLKKGKAIFAGKLDEFGENRTENSFELQVGASLEELTNILDSQNIISIEKSANNFLIKTNTDTKANDLIRKIVDTNTNIKYFRDISSSTKSLFN